MKYLRALLPFLASLAMAPHAGAINVIGSSTCANVPTANQSVTLSHTVPAGTEVVGVSFGYFDTSNDGAGITVSWNNPPVDEPFTGDIVKNCTDGDSPCGGIFTLTNPTPGGPGDLVIDLDQAPNSGIDWIACAYNLNDVNTATPTINCQLNAQQTSISIFTQNAEDWVIGYLACFDGSTSCRPAVDTGTTEITGLGAASNGNNGISIARVEGGPGSQTVNWQDQGISTGIGACAFIHEAGAPPPAGVPPFIYITEVHN